MHFPDFSLQTFAEILPRSVMNCFRRTFHGIWSELQGVLQSCLKSVCAVDIERKNLKIDRNFANVGFEKKGWLIACKKIPPCTSSSQVVFLEWHFPPGNGTAEAEAQQTEAAGLDEPREGSARPPVEGWGGVPMWKLNVNSSWDISLRRVMSTLNFMRLNKLRRNHGTQ